MNRLINTQIRNVAIIAHVDHGKTTLIDKMLAQCSNLRANQQVNERVMDNMDLERERGITIAAKNCSVNYNGVKINIIDTPGHADFGGEVERALKMADGAILLVDSSEGPLPQTRFVLRKALTDGLKIVVVINKIDRADARPNEVLQEIYDLFIDLGANDAQIEFPVVYAVGKAGVSSLDLNTEGKDLSALFDAVINHIHGPRYEENTGLQILICNLAYSDYLGRLSVGRIFNGRISKGDSLVYINQMGEIVPAKISSLQCYDNLGLRAISEAQAGDIIVLAGLEGVEIGDTICSKDMPKALQRIVVDEPTISMMFTVNTSPFAGTEGVYVQSRKIRERLLKESLHNVALKVEQKENSDCFTVKGRGEFQMAILVETMRREGYELSIGRPEIITKTINGNLCEPVEHLFIDCGDQFQGFVTEKLLSRKGKLINLVNHETGRVRLEFSIPSRGLIGYRSEFLTDTKGTGIMNSELLGYEPYRGDFASRTTGSLVSDRSGQAVAYALFHLEPRGSLFVQPGDKVYPGMIVGEHNRDNDLRVNPCKEKKLSNMRAAGKDENILLTPVLPLTLEKAMEFIKQDELVEVTPKSIRLRKVG